MTGMSSIRSITRSGHLLGSSFPTVFLCGSHSTTRPPCRRYLALSFPARTSSFKPLLGTVDRSWKLEDTRIVSVLPRFHPRLTAHHFHSTARTLQEQRKGEEVKDPPRRESGDASQEKQNTAGGETGPRDSSRSSSSSSAGEGEQGEGPKSKKDPPPPPPPPPPHGDKPVWKVFTDTLRSEFQASKEWNESTKALASSANQFTESESVRRARAAYTAAQDAATSTTASAIRSTGKALGKGAAWTWETPVVKGVRAGVNLTGKAIEIGTRPVRETEVYKKAVGEVKEVIDDGSSSRYGGWTEKEERRKRRELRELNEAKAGGRSGRRLEKMEEDPNAGTNITVHKDAVWKETWRDFKDSNRVMQSLFSLKSTYNESENPLIATARSISDRFANFFAENETARVIKKFREMDPTFQIEPFLREMREYILPEVLDAYVRGDIETLKLWLSAAQFQVYAALTQQYTVAGLKSDGRILDIRHVDILTARLLEPGDVPVFIITCRTQEVHVYRNAKTNDLAAGMEDKVQLVTYAIGVTRVPEDVNNPETRGWRLIELQKSGRDYI
ncbi:MAG: protein translocase subunit [Peltula sp. TS41687]|nr:MAG: protein translocase subunit [Peltula sp. TS41687]